MRSADGWVDSYTYNTPRRKQAYVVPPQNAQDERNRMELFGSL